MGLGHGVPTVEDETRSSPYFAGRTYFPTVRTRPGYLVGWVGPSWRPVATFDSVPPTPPLSVSDPHPRFTLSRADTPQGPG